MIGATALTSTAFNTPGLGSRDVARDFAAAGRVADVDRVVEIEGVRQVAH